METNRQKKISGVLQKDLAEILQNDAKQGMKGIIISVTKVEVTSDLTQAKVFVSVFPNDKRAEIFKGISSHSGLIKHELAKRTKNQLRRVPELHFIDDDTLDYNENIDKALKREIDNPIKNPEILPKRQKK